MPAARLAAAALAATALLLVGAPASWAVMLSPSYRVEGETLNSGGNESRSDSYASFDAIGEFAAGLSQSANYALQAGLPLSTNTFITIRLSGGAVSFGDVAPDVPELATTTVWVTTDAGNGYTLEVSSSGPMDSGTDTLPDFTGTIASPASWPSSLYGFGFTLLATSSLADSSFSDSADSAALRTNGTGQDWYESRAQAPTLLTLDEATVGGNATKKARLASSTTQNAYLSQELAPAATSTVTLEWEVYVDDILDNASIDRAAPMMVGDDSGGTNGPNSASAERFVHLAFYRLNGGDTGTMSLLAQEAGDTYSDSSTWRTIALGLNLDQWYTVRVVCDLAADTYDVYVNGSLAATAVAALNTKTSLTHVSFGTWNDVRGTSYFDNVTADSNQLWDWQAGTLYAGFPTTPTAVFSTTTSLGTGTDTKIIQYRANVSTTQPTGTYQTDVTYTAVANL